MNNEYSSNGVIITPDMPERGKDMNVKYDGLLFKSGAQHIYAQIGYGSDWKNQQFFRMERDQEAFKLSVPVVESEVLNICFKDCANNWDNNSGMNYSFPVRS